MRPQARFRSPEVGYVALKSMAQVRRERERRFRVRWRRNLMLGVVVGAFIGSALGLALGLLAFEPGSTGMWASIVAGLIFGLLLGAFEGGMSSLESPQPGREPLEADHAVRDVEGLTDVERENPRARDRRIDWRT